MKNMNTRKRVSFGSKGSVVETWIIQDQPPAKENERHFYRHFVDKKHNCVPMSPEKVLAEVDSRHGILAETNNNLLLSDLPHAVPSWPLKRTQSLESRDNPFLPDGELAKEATDLLKRAHIIRDKFYLDVDGNLQPYSPTKADADWITKGDNAVCNSQPVGEEPIIRAVANQAASEAKRGENGKVADATPDAVKVDVASKDQLGSDDETTAVKDKKKRNKCCSIM